MKYKVKYLDTVRHDREAIKKYMSQYSSTAAKRLFERVKAKVERVKENPHMYEVYWRRPQFRRIVVGDYVVFYRIVESENVVEVHHILHGMMDIEQRLDAYE